MRDDISLVDRKIMLLELNHQYKVSKAAAFGETYITDGSICRGIHRATLGRQIARLKTEIEVMEGILR